MIFRECPDNFNPRFQVASCIVECDGSILLLHRQDYKPEGNTWCLPGGKIDGTESEVQTALREMEEESGIVAKENELKHLQSFFVKYDDYDFIYHMFKIILNERPNVLIRNDEHKDYKWIFPQDALEMNLIQDLDKCIEISYFGN